LFDLSNDVRYPTPVVKPVQAIAHNLRERRVAKGLSISQLARLAGVSKSTVSALERANGNPAIETLWALANALELPFSALFDRKQVDGVEVKTLRDAPIVATQDTGIKLRSLRSRHGRGDWELYMIELEAGARRDAAPHPKGHVEHIIVLEGKVDVGPNGDSRIVKAGDYLMFPADTPHHYDAVEGRSRLLGIADYP
jgi:transcriptional regulator with XRE-family HTH domain